MKDPADPLGLFGSLGDEFQILDILADRSTKLMSEHEPSEHTSLALPAFGEGFKANILSEQNSSQR